MDRGNDQIAALAAFEILSRPLHGRLLAGAQRARSKVDRFATLRDIRVAVLSGTPKVAGIDPWGGFGDVAANLQIARQLRRRNPTINVCLVVCDPPVEELNQIKSIYPEAKTASCLLAGMVPAFDPECKGRFQLIDGIDFLVPDLPLMSRALRHGASGVGPALPPFDVAVTFNDNRSSSARLLRLAAPLRFIIDEPGRDRERFRRADLPDTLSGEHCLNAGADHLGYYIDPVAIDPLKGQVARQAFVSRLAALSGRNFSPETRFALTYPGRESAAVDYAALLFAAASQRYDHMLVLALGAGRGLSAVTPDTIVALPDLCHEDFEKVVWLSDMPPLITGDVSVSLALEATARGRGFLYSRPSWKHAAIRDLEHTIADAQMELHARKLPPESFRATLHCCLWAGSSDLASPGATAAFIASAGDAVFHSEMAEAVQATTRTLSAVKNLELLIIWAMIADPVFCRDQPPAAFDNVILAFVRRSADLQEFLDSVLAWLGRGYDGDV